MRGSASHIFCFSKKKFFLVLAYYTEHSCSYSNWGTESDPEFKGYHNGNSDPRGFGMHHSDAHVYSLKNYFGTYNIDVFLYLSRIIAFNGMSSGVRNWWPRHET